ncbi:hypothetical protein Hanom_Chr04g00325421 [Helianthus anomalus]
MARFLTVLRSNRELKLNQSKLNHYYGLVWIRFHGLSSIGFFFVYIKCINYKNINYIINVSLKSYSTASKCNRIIPKFCIKHLSDCLCSSL